MSKADEPAPPTEEQVKEANAQEEERWQGDFKEEDLKIPYSNEEKDEDDKKDKKSDKVEDSDDKENTPAEDEVYSDPAPVKKAENPGEYKPADYSFDVTLAEGKKVTIKTPEEADKLAEDPDNFETPAQLLSFIRQAQKMENKLDKDKEKHEEKVEAWDEFNKEESSRQETISTMSNEFKYLVSKGKIPAVAKEYADADWQDSEVAKQPGVKEQKAILDYMVKENKERAKANVSPLTSVIDAYAAWSAEESTKQAADDKKEAGEKRKSASSKVAGVSPSHSGAYVPKGIAVGDPNVLKRGAANWDN